jgi:hypothetical protein
MCAGLLQADVYDVYRLLESFAVQRRKFFEKPHLHEGIQLKKLNTRRIKEQG